MECPNGHGEMNYKESPFVNELGESERRWYECPICGYETEVP